MDAWNRWLKAHRHELVRSPVPAFAYDDVRRWTHLVEHGFVASGSDVFDVSHLNAEQAAELLAILDSAPELDTVLAQETRFAVVRTHRVVLEAVLRFADPDDAIEAPSIDVMRSVIAELPVRVERSYDRFLVDRCARLVTTVEPPGLIVFLYSDTMTAPRALEIATMMTELVSTRTARHAELIPLSWPKEFDDAMEQLLEKRA
jgi:hypothetical protein